MTFTLTPILMAFPNCVKDVDNWERFYYHLWGRSFTCHRILKHLFHLRNFLALFSVKTHFLVLSSQIFATGEAQLQSSYPKLFCCFIIIQFTPHDEVPAQCCMNHYPHFWDLGRHMILYHFCHGFYLNGGNRVHCFISFPFLYAVYEASAYFSLMRSAFLLLKVNSVKIKMTVYIWLKLPAMCSSDIERQKHLN